MNNICATLLALAILAVGVTATFFYGMFKSLKKLTWKDWKTIFIVIFSFAIIVIVMSQMAYCNRFLSTAEVPSICTMWR